MVKVHGDEDHHVKRSNVFKGDLMQQRAGVCQVDIAHCQRHRQWESSLKRRHAFWWASDRSSILRLFLPFFSLSLPAFAWSSPLSYNETRIILILPHLVTETLYLKRRADYNNLFAPSGAGLTRLSNTNVGASVYKEPCFFENVLWSTLSGVIIIMRFRILLFDIEFANLHLFAYIRCTVIFHPYINHLSSIMEKNLIVYITYFIKYI